MTATDPLHLYLRNMAEAGETLARKQTAHLYPALLRAQSDLGQGMFVVEGTKVIFINDALCRMCGYAADELQDLDSLLQLLTPEYRDVQRQRYRDRLAGKPVPDTYEIAVMHRDGHRVELEAAAHLYQGGEEPGVMVMVRDITERKRVEAALQESEERFRTIADSAPLAIWLADTHGGIEYCNRAWLNFTGRTLAEEQAGAWRDDFHPDDRQAALDAFTDAVAEQLPYKVEYRARRRDGAYRWLLTTGKPRFREDDVFAGLVGTSVDIHDRKKSEERREQALRENARLLAEVRAAAARQRVFMREILEIVTDGRLYLRDSFAELPQPLPVDVTPNAEPIPLSRDTLRYLRDSIEGAAKSLGFPEERWKDLVTGAGEAGMNAVIHGQGGTARLYADHDAGSLQVWISDRGTGIDVNLLHRATIQPGYSSVGTLGYGFWIMLKTCDRVHLLTGPEGTTLVLEQGIASPTPAWFDKGRLGF